MDIQSKEVQDALKSSFVSLKPEEGGIMIEWSVMVLYKNEAEDGKYSCYIPQLGLHMSAYDRETLIKKENAFLEVWFEHYIKLSGRVGIKNLIAELIRRGFVARDQKNVVLSKNFLIHEVSHKPYVRNLKFKSIAQYAIPEGFENARASRRKSERLIPMVA